MNLLERILTRAIGSLFATGAVGDHNDQESQVEEEEEEASFYGDITWAN